MSGAFEDSVRRRSSSGFGRDATPSPQADAPVSEQTSPYMRRSTSHRASVFLSSSLNAHMEDARAQEAVASPKKSKNPRIPAPIEKVVPPPDMHMELLSPLSPTRTGSQPQPVRSNRDHPTKDLGGTLSTVFVPVRRDHGAYVMLPKLDRVVRCCTDHAKARVTQSPNAPGGVQGFLDDPSAVAGLMQCASSDAAVCGWVRYDAQDSAASPIAAPDAMGTTSHNVRFLDLRWVPHAHGIFLPHLEPRQHSTALAPAPQCPSQCVLMTTAAPLTQTALEDQHNATIAVTVFGDGAAMVTTAVTRGDDGCNGFPRVQAWIERLLKEAAAPPTATLTRLCTALVAYLADQWASAPVGTTWIVALPLCRMPQHGNGRDALAALPEAVVDVKAALSHGREGYAVVSDGADNIHLIGGMTGQEFLSCSQRRHPGTGADAAFVFHRTAVRLRRNKSDGCGLFFDTAPRAMHSKSLTVPGVAYHSAVMRNPPESLRDPPNRVLVFGGFLDCVRKATTGAPTSQQNPDTHAALSLSTSGRETARYGWLDCIVDGAAYNTTADSPVFIPTRFNRDLVLQRSRAATGGGGCGGTSTMAPSWELAHMGDHSPRLTCTNALWTYDCTALTWQHTVATGVVPSPRAHHTSVVCGQWMITAGGVSGDSVPCSDVFALHVDQHVWVQILTTIAPLGLHPLLLATPASLLMAPRPSDRVEAASEWTAVFSQCDLPKLLRNAQGKKRVELAALRHQADLRDCAATPPAGSGGRFVVRSQQELDDIMQRLTAADAASAAALAQLRDKHQAAADAQSGASSHLRMVRRPASQLDEVATRLLDKGRGERRFDAAMAFVKKRYDPPMQQRKRLTRTEVEQSANRLSDMTVALWAKQHAARLKALDQRRLELRLPPSAVRMRKRDASYQPPAIASEDIVERLAPKDYWERREAFAEVFIDKLQTSIAQSQSVQRSGRRSKSPANASTSLRPRTPNELYRTLSDNEAHKEEQCKLFEKYIVEPELLRH